ncbi:MAG: hypothetical protein Q8M08_07690 [Bacteroidales bacterium]|nr:hypothetical protein [Bacteroidales bacterium]
MNVQKVLKRSIMIVAAFTGIMTIQAQDRIFTYTYQSTVLNKGQRELESWHTIRAGKSDFFVRYDNRTEYEIGLGSNLQTAFYLNFTSKTKTMMDDTIKSLSTETEFGFSNEWKLKLLDPVADPIGLALYAEVGIASNEFEIEGKVIVDKKMGNLTIAFNGVYEQEFAPHYEKNKLKWDTEQKLDGYLAFAWSFSPRFQLTLENAIKNVFEDGKIAHSALYSGLGFAYNLEHFWANFTVMPQLTSFKGATGNNLNLNEYEKIQFRLLFSYMF